MWYEPLNRLTLSCQLSVDPASRSKNNNARVPLFLTGDLEIYFEIS